MGEARYAARLFLGGVLLPAIVAAADLGLIAPLTYLFGRHGGTTVLYFLLAGQLVLWNYLVGRYAAPGLLRWALFGWALGLANLLALRLTGPCAAIFSSTLISAEMGLLVAWGVLGTARWPWRVPGSLVTLVCASYLVSLFTAMYPSTWWYGLWVPALAVQSVGLVLLVLALRQAKFVLIQPEEATAENADRRLRSQFTLRDMLLWTLTLVPILTILPRLENGPQLYIIVLSALPALAVGLGLCLLVATTLWAVLAQRSRLGRTSLVFGAVSAVGLAMKAILTPWNKRHYQWPGTSDAHMWFAWTALLACFAIALAWAFRQSGYRLLRYGVPATPATNPPRNSRGGAKHRLWITGASAVLFFLVALQLFRTVQLQRAYRTMATTIPRAGGRFSPDPTPQITLIGDRLSDANLGQLEILADVDLLYISSTQISGTGFEAAQGVEHLKQITLCVSLSDEGMAALSRCTNLEELLIFSSRPISNQGLQHLARLHKLNKLTLQGSGIADASVPALKQLSSLQVLQMPSSGLSPKGQKELQQALPNCTISK